MADIHDKKNLKENEKSKNKSIDVTKPRYPYQSRLDASRVSAYTMKEQQSLDKLKQKMGTTDEKSKRESHWRTIIAIILILLLLLLAILFLIFIGRRTNSPEELYEVRVSMQIDNKSLLTVITETGQQTLREINPGDKIPLRASVRNAFDIRGDVVTENTSAPPIYLRYQIKLILDYEDRYDIIVPTMSERWYQYDQSIEDLYPDGKTATDNYFYYLGSLAFMQADELFSEVLFDGNVIDCDDGGKYGQIYVEVEAVEADIGRILDGELWPTAPMGWRRKMIEQWNN